MTTICLTFHIHHPYLLKKYRFFDIGINHAYYDHFTNKNSTETLAETYYLETNQFLLDLMKIYPDKIKVNFAISGLSLTQFEEFSPELIQSFKKLARSENVEFLAGTYPNSVASLYSKPEFERQVNQHKVQIEQLFGLTPLSFCNTSFIFSDAMGEWIHNLGFLTAITEDAEAILGWNSGSQYYSHPTIPNLRIALRNSSVSTTVAKRLSDNEWKNNPINEIDLAKWIDQLSGKNKEIQIHIPYHLLGGKHMKEKQFLISELMELLSGMNVEFATVSEAAKRQTTTSILQIPKAISSEEEWQDARNLIKNELQEEALEKLYALESRAKERDNPEIMNDWNKLQAFDHFKWMMKSDEKDQIEFLKNPYENAYEAFMNYMNVLNDFALRLGSKNSTRLEESALQLKLQEEISKKNMEIKQFKKQFKKIQETVKKLQKQVHKKDN